MNTLKQLSSETEHLLQNNNKTCAIQMLLLCNAIKFYQKPYEYEPLFYNVTNKDRKGKVLIPSSSK